MIERAHDPFHSRMIIARRFCFGDDPLWGPVEYWATCAG
jgi:hypothetical protein